MKANVVRDAETGEAVIAGTEVTVASILSELESAGAVAVVNRHPELTAEAVKAAVEFASLAVDREARYHVPPGAGTAMVRERALSPAFQGGGGSVLPGAEEYEELLDEVELLRELCAAHAEAAAGETVSNEEALAFFRSQFGG